MGDLIEKLTQDSVDFWKRDGEFWRKSTVFWVESTEFWKIRYFLERKYFWLGFGFGFGLGFGCG